VPHPLYLALGADAAQRQAAYRALFRAHLSEAALADIRLALNQNQPLGGGRFLAQIERALGERREARPRGRPATVASADAPLRGQRELPL
jgi:putative transposase